MEQNEDNIAEQSGNIFLYLKLDVGPKLTMDKEYLSMKSFIKEVSQSEG